MRQEPIGYGDCIFSAVNISLDDAVLLRISLYDPNRNFTICAMSC